MSASPGAFTSVPNTLHATGSLDPQQPMTELRLEDGRILRLATALLVSSSSETEPSFTTEPVLGEGTVIPLVEERLQVGKRTVATGVVRLQKSVQEFEAVLDEPLAVRTYDIERVVMNQPVEETPSVRTEGDMTVYPVVEERLILTKQLVLVEEVRVSRRDTERRDTQTVVLRKEHIEVERA